MLNIPLFIERKRSRADNLCNWQVNGQVLLLLNNSLVPWFIILPITSEIELYKLPGTERSILERYIDILSAFIVEHFNVDKLNVATIGNVVNQMHIHIVGRHENDYCWPDVVWGRSEKELYQEPEVQNILDLTSKELGESFIHSNSL